MKIEMVFVCSENLDKMEKTEKGFYCAVCKKEVLDFRNKKSIKIAEAVSKDGELCGRVYPQQILELNFNSFFQRFQLWNLRKRISVILFFVMGGMLFSCASDSPKFDGQLAGAIAIQDTLIQKHDTVSKVTKKITPANDDKH